MWNTPSPERLDRIPRLYETESVSSQDKLIHLHFFFGGSDWFVAEFDGEDTFWGFVILNGDSRNAEWGYFSFHELQSIYIGGIEINCELEDQWWVRSACEVGKIKQAQVWQIPA